LSVISTFTAALNASHLEKLNLSSNTQLSDPFIATFLTHLNSLHLRDLCLSIVGLTPLSVPIIILYISSPRSRRLLNLSLNGNALGSQGVTEIIKAIKQNNFALGKVELYSNHSGEFGSEAQDASRENELLLKSALIRNQFLRGQAEKEALSLLVLARASLLRPKYQQDAFTTTSSRRPHTKLPTLPTELQHHTLSFLAPTLSSAQRIRIYTYASTSSTLPPLLPRLTSNVVTRGATRPDPLIGPSNITKTGHSVRGVISQREGQRSKWLKAVGCDFYEQEDIVGEEI
jgi:hypothetical protein